MLRSPRLEKNICGARRASNIQTTTANFREIQQGVTDIMDCLIKYRLLKTLVFYHSTLLIANRMQ